MAVEIIDIGLAITFLVGVVFAGMLVGSVMGNREMDKLFNEDKDHE